MMGLHSNSIFKNSCLKVPLNPTNRLPSAKYERYHSSNSSKKDGSSNKKMSFDSNYSSDKYVDETSLLSFREFYKSIPDYEDVTHMTNREFYMTLESLKENKNKLLMKCGKGTTRRRSNDIELLNDEDIVNKIDKYISVGPGNFSTTVAKNYDSPQKDFDELSGNVDKLRLPLKKSCAFSDIDSPLSTDNYSRKGKSKQKYDKTDYVLDNKNSMDILNRNEKKRPPTPRYLDDINLKEGSSVVDDLKDMEFVIDDNYFKKSYSLPSSPIKKRKYAEIDKILDSTMSFSYKNGKSSSNHSIRHGKDIENKMLKNGNEFKQFRANPVPIESRIPLYDKIVEDQELRRSISKLQSTAELQAQMKPFTFTEREERQNSLLSSKCYRICRSNPQLTLSSPVSSQGKSKSFKAKPVPKNLFSNYVYEKMREDDFYRALNRRIRAEEMLKAASLPPSMAQREKLKNEYSVTPTLQEVIQSSTIQNESLTSSSSGESIKGKDKKGKRRSKGGSRKKRDRLSKEYEQLKKEFINETSPRKSHSCNNEDLAKKIYGTHGCNSSSTNSIRVHSAVDIPSTNKSNLAALLRVESTKRRMEAEMLKILEEERYQSEVKWRDSVLRRKPAWNSIKYNHANELALRLQTRKEEERLRREQFLHEMELMYGRVHQQPLMFERAYPPKRHDRQRHNVRDKLISSMSKELRTSIRGSPIRSRKVSINETAETIGDDIDDMLYQISDDDDDKASKSSDIPESIGNGV